jgi:hypothetical protein
MPPVSTRVTLDVRPACETCSILHKQAGIIAPKNITPKNTVLRNIARMRINRTIIILKSITLKSIAPTMRELETTSFRRS